MAAVDSVSRSLKVAHVNTDSLWANYELVGVRLAELEEMRLKSERRIAAKNSQLEGQLTGMMNELQTKYSDLEAKGAGMSETIRNMRMQELQDLDANTRNFQVSAEQEIIELQTKLGQELADEELKHTSEIQSAMKNYLAEYNADKHFTYVLAYANSGGILLGDSALDITADVVKGLNDAYFAANPPAEEVEE